MAAGATSLLNWLGDVGSLLAAVTAVLALFEGIRAWYRRTLGRRRDRYGRLARLGAGAQLSFFADVLGESPAMRQAVEGQVGEYDQERERTVKRPRTFNQCLFIDRDYYVQAMCDEEETVVVFSVTTRSRRFKPAFSFPPQPSFQGRRRLRELVARKRSQPAFLVVLGQTKFDGVFRDRDWRPRRRATLGARTWAYTELYYLGNPGYYQHYGFTSSSAVAAPIGRLEAVQREIGHEWVGGVGDAEALGNEQAKVLDRFRRETVVTTYTVIGPHFNPDDYPATFGPHGDEVRVLP